MHLREDKRLLRGELDARASARIAMIDQSRIENGTVGFEMARKGEC